MTTLPAMQISVVMKHPVLHAKPLQLRTSRDRLRPTVAIETSLPQPNLIGHTIYETQIQAQNNFHCMPSLGLKWSSLHIFWLQVHGPQRRPRAGSSFRTTANKEDVSGTIERHEQRKVKPDHPKLKTSRRTQLLSTAGLFALHIPANATGSQAAGADKPAPAAGTSHQASVAPGGAQGIQALRDPQINRYICGGCRH